MLCHICFAIYALSYMLYHICFIIYALSYMLTYIHGLCNSSREPHACADTLFTRSVKAEIERYPELLTMTPAEAAKDPPPRLFPKRLKGYFKVPVLSRVNCLRCFAKIGRRGEFMTQWKCPVTGETYDGSIYFAHAFCIFYLNDMAPACSVVFKDPGYIYSSSQVLKTIRKFVTCLFLFLCMCARVVADLLVCIHAGLSGGIVWLCVVAITT